MTLVFDEVDAGIGGEASLAVGRALADLGRRYQVLVVTHLAQVAAFADAQIAREQGRAGRAEFHGGTGGCRPGRGWSNCPACCRANPIAARLASTLPSSCKPLEEPAERQPVHQVRPAAGVGWCGHQGRFPSWFYCERVS